MTSVSGNGLLLCLPFPDNGVVSTPRTFLSIKEEDGHLHLLNVSSLNGKEHSLLYSSNVEIQKYNPPFKLRSMVKLNSLYKVEICKELSRRVLCKGQQLDSEEFKRIYQLHEDYVANNEILESKTTAADLRIYLAK